MSFHTIRNQSISISVCMYKLIRNKSEDGPQTDFFNIETFFCLPTCFLITFIVCALTDDREIIFDSTNGAFASTKYFR